MFKVLIDLKIRLQACPPSGFAAFDWRKANKLPQGTSNLFNVYAHWSRNETLCRGLEPLCDSELNIGLSSYDIIECDCVSELQEYYKRKSEYTLTRLLQKIGFDRLRRISPSTDDHKGLCVEQRFCL